MPDEPVFLFIATYDSLEDAEVDYEAIKALHKEKMIGTYDVAVVAKDDKGKVHVKKHEKPTQHGAWTGVAVGAALGIIFPPGIIVGAAAGGLIGGLIGHFWRGMSRKDVMELGEVIDDGEAAIVLVGVSAMQKYLEKALKKARKQVSRELDLDAKEVERELKEAAKEAR